MGLLRKYLVENFGLTAARTVLTQFGFAPGWPGNVRELENAMERAVALARGSRVETEDLPEEIRHAFPTPVASRGTVRPLDEVEKDYILAALEVNGGNQTHTAAQLRIGAATLYRKLKSYGLIGPKRAAGKPARAASGSRAAVRSD
jgi:transcriptional regulator of acetoin/glycerol metabolism